MFRLAIVACLFSTFGCSAILDVDEYEEGPNNGHFVAKYDSQGGHLWTNLGELPFGGMVLDGEDNLINAKSRDAFGYMEKSNPNGELVWSVVYELQWPEGMAVDSSGNIYSTGSGGGRGLGGMGCGSGSTADEA